jgi:hypothetical protein
VDMDWMQRGLGQQKQKQKAARTSHSIHPQEILVLFSKSRMKSAFEGSSPVLRVNLQQDRLPLPNGNRCG